ncbi:MAG: T9SS type A sorting domain-containing protein [Elusimicrobia bacterium]|nr:T9SS type A sorting domain-containing protein [Elusimicrobiota bacterium]
MTKKILKYGQVLCLSIFFSTFLSAAAKWTFIVYIAGDNNLDSTSRTESQVLRDINKMEVGVDANAVNVIVLADRQKPEDETGTTYLYKIQHDTDTYNIFTPTMSVSELLPSTTTNELNTGDPATLVVFSTWAIANYPAENYCLVVWDHGSGWWPKSPKLKKNIAQDLTSDNDYITTAELGTALSQISTYLGKKIDIVGFDACLMSQIEIAYQIKDYADYMIASEEKERGWPYDGILQELVSNPNYDSKTFSQKIVEIWDKAYSDETVSYFSTILENRTAAAIELSKIDNLATAIDSFANELIATKKTVPLYLVRNVVDYFTMGSVDLYDLAHIVNQNPDFSDTLCNSADSVMHSVNSCVISNKVGNTHKNSHGISINFPKTKDEWQTAFNDPDNNFETYKTLSFCQATNWDEFLTDYYSKVTYGPQSLNYVVNAPNPYNPSTGNLTIKNFPDNSVINIKIYNLEGKLVREIDGNGTSIMWDGKNKNDSIVASGIYFYIAETQSDFCKGKITVIKK